MPVIGTTDATGGGWVTASGNNNGGVARGVSHDHVQDAGSRVFSSGMPLNSDPDGIVGPIGSKIVSNDGTGAATTDRHGVDKAVSGGTLAFTPATTGTRSEEFIIRGVTTKIGGQTSSDVRALNAGSSTSASLGITRASIPSNYTEGVAAGSSGVRLGVIASQSGTFSNDGNTYDVMAVPSTDITPNFAHHNAADYHTVNATATFVNPADGTDAVKSEIFPSRSVPGELTYHFGAAGGPTTDEYKAKDAFEAADDTSS